jgi:RNA polymerase sigma-70 factor (family 1)
LAVFQGDIELFEAFHSGSPEAADAVFVRYFKPLCFFAERLTWNREEAEDIVAEAFIKLLERRESFQNLLNIKSFLYLAVRNAAVNHLKSVQRHQAAEGQLHYLFRDETQQENVLAQEMIRVEVLAEILREIEDLPKKCREIFKLIFIEGLSTDEIARQMRISPQTVRTQKARALQLLKMRFLKTGRLAVWTYVFSAVSHHC